MNALLDVQRAATAECDGLDEALEHRAELFQAQGMVMVQLDVSLAEAMVRMRAHACTENRQLHDIAADVEARRQRFERDPPSDRAQQWQRAQQLQ